MAGKLHPDIILMDLNMPRLNGREATLAIHNSHPEICIIGLSIFNEAGRAQAMRDAGAVDYPVTADPSTELVAAIRNCRLKNAWEALVLAFLACDPSGG